MIIYGRSVWADILYVRELFAPHEPEAGPVTVDGAVPAESKSPRLANYLLQLILPDRDRATLIGDLEEAYTKDLLPQYGTRGAAFWYWCRVLREMAFYAWPAIKKLLPWGAIFAALASGRLSWLAGLLHRILGQ
jgi:hypothetical protein